MPILNPNQLPSQSLGNYTIKKTTSVFYSTDSFSFDIPIDTGVDINQFNENTNIVVRLLVKDTTSLKFLNLMSKVTKSRLLNEEPYFYAVGFDNGNILVKLKQDGTIKFEVNSTSLLQIISLNLSVEEFYLEGKDWFDTVEYINNGYVTEVAYIDGINTLYFFINKTDSGVDFSKAW